MNHFQVYFAQSNVFDFWLHNFKGMAGKKRRDKKKEDKDGKSGGKPEQEQSTEKIDVKKQKNDEDSTEDESAASNSSKNVDTSSTMEEDLIDLTENTGNLVDVETSTEVMKASAINATKGSVIAENKVSEAMDKAPSPKQKEKKAEEQKGESNENKSVPLIDNSPMATVFLAAPTGKNHKLAIIGRDLRLGNWKEPRGHFEQIVQISKDLSIFKGVVPVPTLIGSQFKFVLVHTTETKLEYEGEGPSDNRTEELLPDSWNFFVFKPKSKSYASKLMDGVTKLFGKSETKEGIAVEFFNILFNHILDNMLSDWDGAFEFLDESLKKIHRAVGDCASTGFRVFLNEWLEKPELQVNFDQMMLLIVGACKKNVFTEKIQEVLQPKSEEFSIYLHKFRRMKRKGQDLVVIMERIAIHAGPEFFWIFFRINRQSEIPKRFRPQEVTESIIKTLQKIPVVLLDYSECASRVVEYLVRWNDIEELYSNMRPVFALNANYQQLLDPLLLNKFLYQKSSIEDMTKILRSDLMKKAFQNREFGGEPLPEQNRTNLFPESVNKIFNQRLPDVIKLACRTPEYMLPVVIPIIDNIVLEKMKTMSNFSKDEYRFFAHLEDVSFNNFPNTKHQIEAMLMKMTREHLKSGSFQSVPSMKLALFGLAERKDIPFLEQAKVINLQKAMSRLPRKFFQNLHSYVNASGTSMEKTLKPYRKGVTKDVVEKLETHFDLMEEILSKVKNQRVPLIELSSLNVCKHLFLMYNSLNTIIVRLFFAGSTSVRLLEEYWYD